jgi:hypothetical protein
MPARHVVVDGSNMATEGNSLPSLKQLDESVRAYILENPDDIVTVVVDATFGHRIPSEERERFEEAELAGEIVSPPAGAIGRGDAFLLRVADKVGAVVLSNDSFQEFHGEYEWLFDKGRLMGGKPVPGVGWIFTPRTPVRGPKSRESVKEAKRKRHAEKIEEPAESGLDMAAERSRGHGGDRKLQRAIAAAVEEAVEPAKGGRKRRRRRRVGEVPSEPLNEPFNFITFIAAHQLADEVEGTVDEFASHGAFISVDGARCYLPLSAMGEVPPRSAREVLRKGERRAFVVQAFDAMRRGIELAVPGFVRPAGTPTAETIDAEIHRGEVAPDGAVLAGAGNQGAGQEGTVAPVPPLTGPLSGATPVAKAGARGRARVAVSNRPNASSPAPPAPVEHAVVQKAVSKRGRPRARAALSPEAPSSERTGTAQKLPPAKKATGRPATRKSVAEPAPGPATRASDRAEPARPAAAKAGLSGAKEPAKKVPAKKVPAKKVPAKKEPAKRETAKREVGKREPATKEAAKRAVAKKGPGTVEPARKQPAKKTGANEAAVTNRAGTTNAPKRAPAAKTGTAKAAGTKAATTKAATTKAATTKAAGARTGGAKAPAAKTSAAKT